MTFNEWYHKQPRGTGMHLIRELGIGPSTIARLNAGEPVATYALAKRISEATGGAVTIEDLCEPQPEVPA